MCANWAFVCYSKPPMSLSCDFEPVNDIATDIRESSTPPWQKTKLQFGSHVSILGKHIRADYNKARQYSNRKTKIASSHLIVNTRSFQRLWDRLWSFIINVQVSPNHFSTFLTFIKTDRLTKMFCNLLFKSSKLFKNIKKMKLFWRTKKRRGCQWRMHLECGLVLEHLTLVPLQFLAHQSFLNSLSLTHFSLSYLQGCFQLHHINSKLIINHLQGPFLDCWAWKHIESNPHKSFWDQPMFFGSQLNQSSNW